MYQSKFWLGWKVKWSCLYEDIAGFPSLTANSLVIKQKSKKVNVDFVNKIMCVLLFESQNTKAFYFNVLLLFFISPLSRDFVLWIYSVI